MSNEEVLKAVFPFLDGTDLVNCMAVCKQWREIAIDDYFWKCLCAKKWPSICKRPNALTTTYYKLYQTFYKRRQHPKVFPPPRLSFEDLEFFIDIWTEGDLIFSEVVRGPVLPGGIQIPPSQINGIHRFHIADSEYTMTLPVEPRFKIHLSSSVNFSVLVARKDLNKMASIIRKSMFDYVDRTSHRAMAFDYLEFSPVHPFIPGIRAWMSLLFSEDESENVIDVYGIEMDFTDAAKSKEEVLWLLDVLDWK